MNIEIVIKQNGMERKSIHPQNSLPDFQRIFRDELVDYYFVDDNGNKIQGDVKVASSPQEKALEAMKTKAKSLKIKGWHLMNEEKLLKAIQEASKPK